LDSALPQLTKSDEDPPEVQEKKKQMKAQYAAAPETERLVMQYYRLDYSFELFNFTLPANYTKKLFGWGTTGSRYSRRGGGQKAAISEEFRQRLTSAESGY